MKVLKTPLEGVVIIEPRLFEDSRGYFFESFSQRDFDAQVAPVRFVQDNESRSCYGVVRGLHFQRPPLRAGEARALRPRRGARRGGGHPPRLAHLRAARCRGAHGGEPPPALHPAGLRPRILGVERHRGLPVQVRQPHAPQAEGAVAWDDPTLGIDWRIPAPRILLSAKDAAHPRLAEADLPFEYNAQHTS